MFVNTRSLHESLTIRRGYAFTDGCSECTTLSYMCVILMYLLAPLNQRTTQSMQWICGSYAYTRMYSILIIRSHTKCKI